MNLSILSSFPLKKANLTESNVLERISYTQTTRKNFINKIEDNKMLPQKASIFPKDRIKVNDNNNLKPSMSQTLSSWSLLRVLCSEITVLSNSSCSSLVWKRMNKSYFRHIVFSSGVKSFSNGFGYNKFLSSMKSFLRFLSSSLQHFSI